MEVVTIIWTIAFVAILEGLLSFDNALALAAMVKHLPPAQRRRALTYGMAGAFIFRTLAIFFVTFIMANVWVKILGGAYLVYLTIKFFTQVDGKENHSVTGTFWRTVVMVELTDIAFSIDSILAAVGVSNNRNVIIAGGIMGIIMMRFAAVIFIRLIDIFPRLEQSAFILVGIVGTKLLLEGAASVHFDGNLVPVFWTLMGLGLAYGFTERRGTIDV